jgi:hypothetical protein
MRETHLRHVDLNLLLALHALLEERRVTRGEVLFPEPIRYESGAPKASGNVRRPAFDT